MSKLEKTIIKDVYMLDGAHLECSDEYCFCNDQLYFSKEMIANNLFINCKGMPNKDELIEGGMEYKLSIQLIHVTDLGVKFYYFYDGEDLSTIQEQMIVKEIAQLFTEHTLPDFFDFVNSLTVGNIFTNELVSAEEKYFLRLQGMERLKIIKQHIQEAS
ncbi:MAG TPA: hypothetical protein VNS08_03040 [Ureibacillus sp.]|nr:hypothetical protein [Ureibacillus sp.]